MTKSIASWSRDRIKSGCFWKYFTWSEILRGITFIYQPVQCKIHLSLIITCFITTHITGEHRHISVPPNFSQICFCTHLHILFKVSVGKKFRLSKFFSLEAWFSYDSSIKSKEACSFGVQLTSSIAVHACLFLNHSVLVGDNMTSFTYNTVCRFHTTTPPTNNRFPMWERC